MPNEQEKTILTQKIRDPRDGQENSWIDIFEVKVKNNTDTSPTIYTKSIITDENMYKGEINEKRPVSENTIQNGAVTTSKISPEFIGRAELQRDTEYHNKIFGSDNHQDYSIIFFYTSSSTSEVNTT